MAQLPTCRIGMEAFANRLIGECEIVRLHESQSTRPGEFAASKTRSEQHVTDSAVLPAEIEQLPDLERYLKIASEPVWLRVRVPADHRFEAFKAASASTSTADLGH